MKTFFNNPIFHAILAIIGTIAGIIGVVFGLIEEAKIRWTIFWGLIGAICLIVLVCLVVNFIKKYKLIRKTDIEKLNAEIAILKSKNECRESNFKRFEGIKKIKYGYIDYKPFFWLKREGIEYIHNGIGYDVLKEILKLDTRQTITLESHSEGSSWDSIFRDLQNGKYDIVIAPLFETRSRLNEFNIAFCSPLFYSNIGLYIKKTDQTKLLENSCSFSEAIQSVKKHIKEDDWKGCYLEGELSYSLIKKNELLGEYTKKISPSNPASDDDFIKIISEVASENVKRANFTFMEVFKAETLKGGKPLNVVNILRNKELLYPVSFAVRKEDTALRNLINLRLMEMEQKEVVDDNGNTVSELKKIIKTAAVKADISPSEFEKIFVRKKYGKLLPCSGMTEKEYRLLDEVYGNYTSFEQQITPIVRGYNSTTEINVLEIGCGTGITTKILLNSRENIKLKTIDIDDETIKNMKESYPNNAKIEPLCSDVREFVREQNDNSFDIIVSAFTIHNLTDEDRKPLYKEIYRILKNGGLFINADKFVSDDKEKQIAGLKYRIGTYIEVLLKKEKYDLLKEWAVHYIDDHQPDKLLKPTETQKYFQKIGFKNIEYTQYGKEEEMLGLLTAEK